MEQKKQIFFKWNIGILMFSIELFWFEWTLCPWNLGMGLSGKCFWPLGYPKSCKRLNCLALLKLTCRGRLKASFIRQIWLINGGFKLSSILDLNWRCMFFNIKGPLLFIVMVLNLKRPKQSVLTQILNCLA